MASGTVMQQAARRRTSNMHISGIAGAARLYVEVL
jgi:hypothetical protein